MSNEKIITAKEPNNSGNSVPESIHHLGDDSNKLSSEEDLLDKLKNAKSNAFNIEEKPSSPVVKIHSDKLTNEDLTLIKELFSH